LLFEPPPSLVLYCKKPQQQQQAVSPLYPAHQINRAKTVNCLVQSAAGPDWADRLLERLGGIPSQALLPSFHGSRVGTQA
ncbi:unnamed protein product, partial [Ascophyllum nodosum]